MSTWQIVLLVIVCVIVVSFIIAIIVGEVCYHVALSRKNIIGKEVFDQMHDSMDLYQIDYSWWKKVDGEQIEIEAADKTKLCACYIKNKKPTDKIAIVLHGYMSNYTDMQRYCKMFYDMGYNIMAPDHRGHGKSGGKYTTMGKKESFDAVLWTKYAKEKLDAKHIVVFGLSMGAATVCMMSNLKMPNEVDCLISDCAYTNALEEFMYVTKNRIRIPLFITIMFFNIYAKLRTGSTVKSASPIDHIKHAKKPILLIHGDCDQFVPYYMHAELIKAAPKNLVDSFVVKGADHALSQPTDSTNYAQKVKEFLEKHVKD